MEELTHSAGPKAHTLGRPHIASLMVAKGYVRTFQDAFTKYIGEGRPCYTAGSYFSVQETLNVLKEAGALAVIAHPHLIKKPEILKELLDMPFDGIECYYGTFNNDQNRRFLAIAEKKGWLITGGSDFHGTIKPNIALGASWTPKEHFDKLIAKCT
jgi:predicted metal-dependent phosphoesterase TrpH